MQLRTLPMTNPRHSGPAPKRAHPGMTKLIVAAACVGAVSFCAPRDCISASSMEEFRKSRDVRRLRLKRKRAMPADQTRVGPDTPMGATTGPGGVTFRAWAPRATEIYVAGSFNAWRTDDEAFRLVKDANGYWSGFLPGVKRGDQYKFFVSGRGSKGFQRDPNAREIVAPDWNCVVTDASSHPWHDAGFRSPAYADLIIYQLHVGTFHAARPIRKRPAARPGRDLPRRAGPAGISGRPRRDRDRAAADRGIPDQTSASAITASTIFPRR